MAEKPIRDVYIDIDRAILRDNRGLLKHVKNIRSVEQSIETILLTPLRSRKFLPEFGSRLSDLLFEPISEGIAIRLQNEVRSAINRWDPRIVITEVDVLPRPDENAYFMEIRGFVPGLDEFTFARRFSSEP